MIYHRQMKIRFLKISQVIDNQVIVKNIETENSIADGIMSNTSSLMAVLRMERWILFVVMNMR
jgi:hypothetical protein